MAKRTNLQGKQREGALEVDIRWVAREEHHFQAHPTFHTQWVVFALWTVMVSVIPVKWRVCSHRAQWKLRGPILTVQIQTPHCQVDPSQGQNTQGHRAELALLCASTNLAKMSAFTHSPHHTVNTWSPPELPPWAKRPSPLLSCSMKFLFSRPSFSRNPSISYFIAWTHMCVHTLLVFVVALEQCVVPILLSLYISWAPTVMKNQDKYNLFYISCVHII